MYTRTTIGTLAAVLAALIPIRAQVRPPAAGDRVRVTTDQPHTGVFLSIDSAALRLRPDHRADTVAIPLPDITKLELSAGRKSHTWQGILIGTLAGGGLALLAAEPANEGYTCDRNHPGAVCISPAIFAAVFLVGGGAVAGGLIGRRIRTDRWEPVPALPFAIGMAPPDGRRFGVVVTLRL